MKSLNDWICFFIIYVAAFLFGLYLTQSGLMTYDTQSHLERSQWIINKYSNLFNDKQFDLHNQLKWYGPLFEIFLGFMSEVVFKFFNDSIWIRFALTFAIFPTTLFLIYKLLIQSGVSKTTSLLSCSLLFGFIRWGGHSVVNPVDFPFSCFFLVIILWSWNYLKKSLSPNRPLSNKQLITIGIVTLTAFMIRPPVITQFLATLGLLVILSLFSKPKKQNTYKYFFLPLVSGLFFMWLCWPAIWEKPSYKGWHAWLQSFGGFVRFWWKGDITAYGHVFNSHELPRWYAFIWPPVNMHPFSFLGLILGLFFYFYKPRKFPSLDIVLKSNKIFDLSLPRFIWLFTFVAWSGVVVYGPVLYDEDRHLLWLYLPLLLLAGLGLDFLKPKIKTTASIIIILSSLFTYFSWGRYSYIYKSPLVINRSAAQFTGDYWGVCMAPAITELKTIAPPSSIIVVPGPYEIAIKQSERLHSSHFLKDQEFPNYDFKRDYEAAQIKNYYLIIFNRNSHIEKLVAENTPNRSLVWSNQMPLGEPACGIFKIESKN